MMRPGMLAVMTLSLPSALAAQQRMTFLPAGSPPSGVPVVEANDNRRAAGTLRDGVLTLRLVVQLGEWRPNAADGPGIVVPVFAEEGKRPQVPAPLIRVPRGTRVRTTLRNTLRDSIIVRGLDAKNDSVGTAIRAGGEYTFERVADSAGTTVYDAATGPQGDGEEQQLSGAFHVDTAPPRADERIFVINIASGAVDSAVLREGAAEALTINGRGWPHTERIRQNVGDTVRWIVVNGSGRNHPMHLHGFYFRVAARTHAMYPADRQDAVVTEFMLPKTTMAITWVPDRPGNWLFHCHLVFHVIPEANLPDHRARDHGAHPEHMAGLVLGIEVADRTPAVAVAPGASLRLVAGERSTPGGSIMGYALEAAGRRVEVSAPGPVLTLTRDVTTEVTVVNRLRQPTGVHWHGLELESYSDGVPGWSGTHDRVAPMIMPNDSFVARLTVPRAGTFIYHTHLNDIEQLTSGLYGAIVVLDPGEQWDPGRDHVFVLGWHTPKEPATWLLNGDSIPSPVTVAPGRHRLRFVNIGPAGAPMFRLMKDGKPVSWTPLAKDGMTLPAYRQQAGPAARRIAIGETFDAMWEATPGEYVVQVGRPAAPGRPALGMSQKIVVERVETVERVEGQ